MVFTWGLGRIQTIEELKEIIQGQQKELENTRCEVTDLTSEKEAAEDGNSALEQELKQLGMVQKTFRLGHPY